MQIAAEYFVYAVVFISVVLGAEGVYYLFNTSLGGGRGRVNRRLRLQQKTADPYAVLNKLRRDKPLSLGDVYQSLLSLKGPVAWIDRLITQSGLTITTGRFFVIMVSAILMGTAALTMLTRPELALVGGISSGLCLPIGVLALLRRSRLKKFERQLPDAIDIVVRSLRAGHPVPTALGMVAEEMNDPIGTEIGIVVDEMTYGLDLREALESMQGRVGHDDMAFVVAAVNVQSAIGGNLADVLAGLAAVIRDRFRMLLKIRALSAEGRVSAIILSVLPFAVYGVIQLMRPEYFSAVADDPLYPVMMLTGLGLAMCGILMMYRMVKIRV
jgi:tight adherence protein B